MEYQAVSDMAQMHALQVVMQTLLHGFMLMSAITFGLIGLLCFFEARPARTANRGVNRPIEMTFCTYKTRLRRLAQFIVGIASRDLFPAPGGHAQARTNLSRR